MSAGFVYLLGNRAMPCFYKIGCTTGPPSQRALQLSSATGVPHHFDLMLYTEVPNCEAAEQRLHDELTDFRPNMRREFFVFGPAHMAWLWNVFASFPGAQSFSEPCWSLYAPRPTFPDDHVETWVLDGEALSSPDSPPIAMGDIHVSV